MREAHPDQVHVLETAVMGVIVQPHCTNAVWGPSLGVKIAEKSAVIPRFETMMRRSSGGTTSRTICSTLATSSSVSRGVSRTAPSSS